MQPEGEFVDAMVLGLLGAKRAENPFHTLFHRALEIENLTAGGRQFDGMPYEQDLCPASSQVGIASGCEIVGSLVVPDVESHRMNSAGLIKNRQALAGTVTAGCFEDLTQVFSPVRHAKFLPAKGLLDDVEYLDRRTLLYHEPLRFRFPDGIANVLRHAIPYLIQIAEILKDVGVSGSLAKAFPIKRQPVGKGWMKTLVENLLFCKVVSECS